MTTARVLGLSLLMASGIGCAQGAAPVTAAEAAGPTAGGSGPVDASESGNNLLKNGDFEDGTSLPWTVSFSAPADGKAEVRDKKLCLEVKAKGTNNWDAQLRHREMVIKKGHTYTVRFTAHSTAPTKTRPKVGMSGPPYTEYWQSLVEVTTSPRQYIGRFKMDAADDATAEFAFHMGGALGAEATPFSVCLDDVRLDDPDFAPPPKPTTMAIPNIRVNQLGYLPSAAKRATLKHASRAPVAWELLAHDGSPVAKGNSTVHGEDPDSGEHLHIIDFSPFNKPGRGFILKVGDDKSYAFDIAEDIFKKLKYDALAYFYHNRSGIPITMPFAGDKQWTRPAGHLSDKSVACGKSTGCNYALDVSGGWYDAGDHGKYVVNGGISTWTLLNQYERDLHLGSSVADFGDGKLNIPEHKNGVPDLLDEARYNLEFMLKMQVPAGKPRAGMVHHKVHDVEWTALGMAPHESKMQRHLRPPSTAATLNLAAVAAQGARLFQKFDPGFSAKCLKAAEMAWAAAKANPAVFAPADDKTGGGPYDDKDVADEFYWAAAELLVTTGKPEYRDFVLKSPHFKRFPANVGGAGGGSASSMTWQSTHALGSISLAVVPSTLDKASVGALRAQINAAGDAYAALIEKQGYRVPLGRAQGGKYPWGSNSFVLNNMVVLGLAYDFTKKPKYLNGVVAGMDYILGRNPLGQSYVTGFGENPLQHPHHRFWAHQVNEKYPTAPPGAVSGGPNSGLEDPYAQAAGLKGCAPQKCFVDHSEAWSVNEITINWNAPLAWAAAYLDEKAGAR